MQSCIPFYRPLRRRAPLLAAALIIALASCREDQQSPTAPESDPAVAITATAALAFSQVSAGSVHTCGVTTDGPAYCWGINKYEYTTYGTGVLGNGTTANTTRPVAVAGGHLFRQISSGHYHTCGVTTEYQAYCWGLNSDGYTGTGQLGDGTTTRRLKPVAVVGGHSFRQVSTGLWYTCGVTTGNRAYCWGDNGAGQLGDGTTSLRLTPVAVVGGLSFRQVSAGWNFTCGVTTDDLAYCWGVNNYGQLGDSTTVSTRLTPTLVAGGHQFRQLDAGNYHACAVTTNDRAYCWGWNLWGQIGDGKTIVKRFSPKAVAGGLYFGHVTAGHSYSCGETTTKVAYCWGSNQIGELGDGTTTPSPTPVAVAGGRRFRQLSAGLLHTCGVTPLAVAYCWGENGGMLGDGTLTSSTTPRAVVGP